eukprot:c43234_g1_i1 orf=195-347(+)
MLPQQIQIEGMVGLWRPPQYDHRYRAGYLTTMDLPSFSLMEGTRGTTLKR